MEDGELPERRVAAVCLALAVILLAGSLAAGRTGPPPGPTFAEGVATFAGQVETRLAIGPTPSSVSLGGSVELTAVWTALPTGCVARPLWMLWTTNQDPPVGVLNASTGDPVLFTVVSPAASSVEISVRSAATVACGSESESVVDEAGRELSVTAAMTIANFSVDPPLAAPGASVTVTGLVLGGVSPERVSVVWGDGTVGGGPVAPNGTFRFSHSYPSGRFVPIVDVHDADGRIVDAPDRSALEVTSQPAIALQPAAPGAEVGMPFPVQLEYQGLPPKAWILVRCTSSQPYGSLLPVGTRSVSCSYPNPGPVSITASVLGGPIPIAAEYALNESVAPALNALGASNSIVAEQGRALSVPVNVSGGVPPFRLLAASGGGLTLAAASFWDDGTEELSIPTNQTGISILTFSISDGAGAHSALAGPTLDVAPPLNLSAAVDVRQASNGTFVQVDASPLGGVFPAVWAVLPDVAWDASGSTGGPLAPQTPFTAWLVLDDEGYASLTVLIADASGATARLVVAVPLTPPLGLGVTSLEPIGNASTSSVALSLNLTGGLPPFHLGLRLGNDSAWNLTVGSDGPVEWNLSAPIAGTVPWTLRCTDALGAVAEATGTVNLTAASGGSPSPPGPAPNATAPAGRGADTGPSAVGIGVAAVGVIAGGAAGTYLLVRRWSRNRGVPPPRPPDPVNVLRDLIEPADGADRQTIELLAEEQGVPLSAVRSSIDRLVAEGRILVDTAPDGEEALTWSDPSG